MSKKKSAKKQVVAPAKESQPIAEDPGPFLSSAHPPAKNRTLLVISLILFVACFLFLFLAAISSQSR